jgi:hemerythrin-like domain-containing protein
MTPKQTRAKELRECLVKVNKDSVDECIQLLEEYINLLKSMDTEELVVFASIREDIDRKAGQPTRETLAPTAYLEFATGITHTLH